MSYRPLSFAGYVRQAMRPYRIGIPFVFSLVAGIAVAASVLALRANSDFHLIRAVAPHLSTLVETQDRPEMLRMLSSIARERGVQLVLVQRGQVLASTRSLEELDRPFKSQGSLVPIGQSHVTGSDLVTNVHIARENGPETDADILMFSPLSPILLSCLWIALGVLALSFAVSQLYSLKLISVIRETIRPIEKTDEAIRLLLEDKEPNLPLTGIREIDNIRSTLIETRRSLTDATDRLAEAKSKELVADAYRRLIHDLYTPVAALKETVKIIEKETTKPTIREKAQHRLIRLAEQILNQVSVAKENLQFEPKPLAQDDIRTCVSEAAEQAWLAFPDRDRVQLNQRIPDRPISIPHDSENLRRAISNLVSNALRASRGTVDVELERMESSVAIRVSDDGLGIDEDDISLHLQGRLQSSEGNRPGYGLPSANHIARLHGGRLIYRRSPLGGACFEIRI
jgi:signal transduction histidine kinase